MFSENKNFLVRAVQWGEHIYVWVAYHGDLRQFSDTYRAEITLLLTNEDEPRGNQGDYRGARGGDDNDSVVIIDDDQETGQDGESESEEESEAESDNYLVTRSSCILNNLRKFISQFSKSSKFPTSRHFFP